VVVVGLFPVPQERADDGQGDAVHALEAVGDDDDDEADLESI
jgi:hypothetical protein